MNRLCIWIIGCLISIQGMAQDKKFSPKEFNTQFEAFATEEAKLTPKEAGRFFPLYREMKEKQRNYYKKMRELMKKLDNAQEENCYTQANEELIQYKTATAQVEQEYLKKFRKILSDKKIFLIQKAEIRFHRQALKQAEKKQHPAKK